MLTPNGGYHCPFVLPNDSNTAWLFNTFSLSTAVAHRGFFTTFFFFSFALCIAQKWSSPVETPPVFYFDHLNQILKWLLLKLCGSAQAFLWLVENWGSDLILWKGWSYFWRSLSTCFSPSQQWKENDGTAVPPEKEGVRHSVLPVYA